MRIESIDLRTYGPWPEERRLALDPERPRLHVLFGHNEAGKSTLLRALCAWLYGFPHNTKDDHRYEAKHLRCGGVLIDPRIGRIACQRRKGHKSTLLQEDGRTAYPDGALDPFLQGVDEDLFLRFYALDAWRLREGGSSLSQTEGRADPMALAGPEGELPARAAEWIAAADRIYRQRATTRALNSVIARCTELEQALRDASLDPKRYAELLAAVDEKRARRDALHREMQAAERTLAELERLASVAPFLADEERLQDERARLGQVKPLPIDAREQHQHLSTQAAVLRARREATQREQAALAARRLALAPFEDGGDLPARAQQARERFSAARHAAERMPELDARLAAAEAAVHRRREALSASVAVVHDLSALIAAQAELEQLADRWSAAQAAARRATEQRAAAAAAHAIATEQLAAAGAAPALPDLEALRAAIAEADAKRSALAHRRERREQDSERETLLALTREVRPFFGGSLEAFAALTLPSPLDVLALEERAQRVVSRIELLEAQRRDIDRTDQALAQRATAEGVQDPDAAVRAWDAARALRDAALDRLQADPRAEGGFSSLRQRLSETDRAADGAIRSARASGRWSEIQAQRAERVAQGAALDIELAKARAELSAHREAAAQSYAELLRDPGDAPGRKRLVEAQMEVQRLLDRSETANAELTALEQEAALARRSLHAALDALGCSGASDLDLTALLACAKAHEEALRAARARDAALRADLQRRSEDLATAERAESIEGARLAEVDAERLTLCDALCKGRDFDLASLKRSVRETLALLQAEEVLAKARPEADGARALIDALASDHLDLDPSDRSMFLGQVEERVRQLEAAAQAAAEAQRIDTAAALLAEREREDRAAEAVVLDQLQSLFQLAGAATWPELAEALQRAEQARALDAQIAAARSNLALSVPLLSVAELRQRIRNQPSGELDEHHLATLRAEKARQSEELRAAHSELEAAERAVAAVAEGGAEGIQADLALAEAERDRLLQRWLALRLAASAATELVQRRLEAARGPVLCRATELFKTLTLGRYPTLEQSLEEGRTGPVEELIVRDQSGVRRRIADLSDGTRDQLFLALRLAHIQHRAAGGIRLPLIFDDILVHADDRRAEAALRILGSMTEELQILFLTHEQRHIELAQRTVPQDRLCVHDLDALFA